MNNHGKKWTEEEEELIKNLLSQKKTFLEISKITGRTELALRSRSKLIDLREYILSRNIKELIHFTSVWNSYSIGKYGILSVDELRKKGLEYHYNDESRLDKMLNFISLSISKPNSFLLKEFNNRDAKDWIKFYIKPDVIFRNESYFFFTNAASSVFPENKEDEAFSTVESFKAMFDENINTSKVSLNRKSLKRKLHETTCEQAEVLLKGRITAQNILGWEKISVS